MTYPREFYYQPGNPKGDPERPATVFRALQEMPEDAWLAMCRDLFPRMQPKHVSVALVMQTVRRTDRCQDGSPVRVFIDPEGRHTVNVYFPGE